MSRQEENKTAPRAGRPAGGGGRARQRRRKPPSGEPRRPTPCRSSWRRLKDQAARAGGHSISGWPRSTTTTASAPPRRRRPSGPDAKADTALAFLPVYDNLERALKQETADEAYKKGVEMTMNQSARRPRPSWASTEIAALGQPFDPNRHNAVMHVDDESLGENTVAEVFQAGLHAGRQGGPLRHGEGRQLTENENGRETAQ